MRDFYEVKVFNYGKNAPQNANIDVLKTLGSPVKLIFRKISEKHELIPISASWLILNTYYYLMTEKFGHSKEERETVLHGLVLDETTSNFANFQAQSSYSSVI